jgi:predicted Zn-ribbon and HTH transcriptional regulator
VAEKKVPVVAEPPAEVAMEALVSETPVVEPDFGAVWSDMHCPLLVEPQEKRTETVVEQHFGGDGEPAGKTVHRRPKQLLQRPVECPSCGVMVEREMLVMDKDGVRDCAIAMNVRAAPKRERLDVAAERAAMRGARQ